MAEYMCWDCSKKKGDTVTNCEHVKKHKHKIIYRLIADISMLVFMISTSLLWIDVIVRGKESYLVSAMKFLGSYVFT